MDLSDLDEDQIKVVDSLKQKYPVHEVVFSRSLMRANNIGELFDILDTMPKELPLVWDKKQRRWRLVQEMAAEVGKPD